LKRTEKKVCNRPYFLNFGSVEKFCRKKSWFFFGFYYDQWVLKRAQKKVWHDNFFLQNNYTSQKSEKFELKKNTSLGVRQGNTIVKLGDDRLIFK